MQFPQRGELYWIPSEVPEGESEKDRPIVVLSRDELNRRAAVCVPFFSQQIERRIKLPYCAFFKQGEGGLLKDCVARGDLIQLVPIEDINWERGKLGRFNVEQIQRVIIAIRQALRDSTLGT